MAILSSSSFSFREMLQLVMPTLVGFSLFVPFFEPPEKRVDTTMLIFGAIILSFLISGPVSALADAVKWLPLFKGRLKRCEVERGWVDDNWDSGQIDASLTKDEQEVPELIANYMILTRLICFYVIAYFLWNVVWLGWTLYDIPNDRWASAAGSAGGLWSTLKGVKTPIIGGWLVPTLVILPAAALAVVSMLIDYIEKHRQLFGRDGVYDNLYLKYHQDKGNLTSNVWGWVMKKGTAGGEKAAAPLPGLGVSLWAGDKRIAEEVQSDSYGYFQFQGAFAACGEGCTVRLAEEYEVKGPPPRVCSVVPSSPESLKINSTAGKGKPFVEITVTLKEVTAAAAAPAATEGGGAAG